MKNFLLVLIVIVGGLYYFVPYNIKVSLFEKVGINSSIISPEKQGKVKTTGEIINLKFGEDYKASFNGNLSDGKVMQDLSWSFSSYVKCFNQNQYEDFQGKTIIHRVLLGKRKDVLVKLIPENKDTKLSMYVYKTDPLSKIFPPEIKSFHDCKTKTGIDTEVIIKMNGNTITSDIVVGVVGSSGALDGGYTLEILEK